MAGPSYTIPPWLQNHSSQIAQNFTQGLHIGAQIRMQRERLSQQAVMENMELQAKREENDKRHLREQQQLEMQKAWHDTQAGLRQRALDEAQQKIDLQTRSAAMQFAARRKYEDLFGQSGDAEQAALEAGPDMGGGFTAAMQHIPRPPVADATETEFGGEPFLKIPHGSGDFSYQQIRKPSTKRKLSLQELDTLSQLKKQRTKFQNELDSTSIESFMKTERGQQRLEATQKGLRETQAQIDAILKGSQSDTDTPEGSDTPPDDLPVEE